MTRGGGFAEEVVVRDGAALKLPPGTDVAAAAGAVLNSSPSTCQHALYDSRLLDVQQRHAHVLYLPHGSLCCKASCTGMGLQNIHLCGITCMACCAWEIPHHCKRIPASSATSCSGAQIGSVHLVSMQGVSPDLLPVCCCGRPAGGVWDVACRAAGAREPAARPDGARAWCGGRRRHCCRPGALLAPSGGPSI